MSRNEKFADSSADIRNAEGQNQAGENCTDLCAGWEGYCQAVSLQLQVEEWYSWCCWGPPGHSSRSQGRTRCLKNWLLPRGREMHFGEADVFVTVILRSQHCWKTLSLTGRHNHSRKRGYKGPQSPPDRAHTQGQPSQTAKVCIILCPASRSRIFTPYWTQHPVVTFTIQKPTFLMQHLLPPSASK